jgi:outer membrane receptor protein involved in Fe transport
LELLILVTCFSLPGAVADGGASDGAVAAPGLLIPTQPAASDAASGPSPLPSIPPAPAAGGAQETAPEVEAPGLSMEDVGDGEDPASWAVLPATSFDGLSLEEILNMRVVTATGSEEDRALAPANVLVVTREEIALHGYRSIAELLAGVPGLFVVDDLVNPSLAVRGISGGLRGGTRIVRMMIDGAQVNFRPDLTAFLGPEYIPMDAIERVEIAKGPLSALYGANAFLATVNVITRTPPIGSSSAVTTRMNRLRLSNGFGTSAFLGYNDGNTSLFASFVVDRLDRSGLALQRTFPGQDLTPQIFGERSQNDIRESAGAFVSYRTVSDRLGSLSVQGGVQSMDAGAEFQVNSLLSHASRLALVNLWSNALWERSWSRMISTIAAVGWSQGGPTRNTQLYLPDSRAVTFKPNYSYAAVTGKLEVTFAPGRTLSLAAGIDTEHDTERILYYTQVFNTSIGPNQSGDQVDVGIAPGEPRSVAVRNVAGYLKAGLSPLPSLLPDLRLTGNLRVDAMAQGPVTFPTQESWRAAAAYRFSSAVSAKLIAGQAFQMPSAVLNFARPGYGTIGNIVGVVNVPGSDQLRPQNVTSVEAGASARMLDAFAVEGEIYYQEVKDRIEFVRYGSNYRASNQGETRQAGLAGIVRFVHRPMSLYLGGNVLRSIVAGRISAAPPAGFPNVTGSLGTNVDLTRWYLRGNAELRYTSSRGASEANVLVNDQRPYTLAPYVQADLTLSTTDLHPLGADTETRFLGGVRNLLDTRFSEPGYGGFDTPGLGRMLFLEVRQTF